MVVESHITRFMCNYLLVIKSDFMLENFLRFYSVLHYFITITCCYELEDSP